MSKAKQKKPTVAGKLNELIRRMEKLIVPTGGGMSREKTQTGVRCNDSPLTLIDLNTDCLPSAIYPHRKPNYIYKTVAKLSFPLKNLQK